MASACVHIFMWPLCAQLTAVHNSSSGPRAAISRGIKMKANKSLVVVVTVLSFCGVSAEAQSFEVSSDAGKTVYRVLTQKHEIESKLAIEGGSTPADMPDLSKTPWHQVNKWRQDPVVSQPLTSIADIQANSEELFLAVDQNMRIQLPAKDKLKGKIKAGDCVLGQLRTRYFELMVNKTSIVWKGEVETTLAINTRVCEFNMPEENIFVSVIMDCGNFVFFYYTSIFSAHAEAPKPVEPPPPTKPVVEEVPPPTKPVVVEQPPTPTKPVIVYTPPPAQPKIEKSHKKVVVVVVVVAAGLAGGFAASRGHKPAPVGQPPYKTPPQVCSVMPNGTTVCN